MGNVRDNALSEIWNSRRYVHFRQQLRNAGIWPQCAKCCALNNRYWDHLPVFPRLWDKKQ